MKRILAIGLFAIIFLAGCSVFDVIGLSDETKKEPLTLQLTKTDEEANIVIEENELYSQLQTIVEDDPLQGEARDFSLYIVDAVDHPDGPQLLFLGINRLEKPIQDIEFDFTLGNTDDEFVWDELEVTLPTDVFGAIKSDHAMPVMLAVTEEQIDLMNSIDEDNLIFEIDNFKYNEIDD